MGTGQSGHLMEAGALAIDKGRNLHGLLMACVLNSRPFVYELYERTHGEKESYWIGFEMVRARYHFVATRAAHIGHCDDWITEESVGPEMQRAHRKKDKVARGVMCEQQSHIAHFHDLGGGLWWFNGHFLNQKKDLKSGMRPLNHYTRPEEGHTDGRCILSKIHPVPDKPLLDRIRALWDPKV